MPRAKEFNEEKILQKAMMLFWKKGYYNTSLVDLIEFLGISNASIYNAFGGKKELFEKAFEYYRNINYHGFTNFLSTQDDIKQGLRSAFQKIINDDFSDVDCKGCFVVNTTSEFLPADEKLQEVITQYKTTMVKAFHNFLKKGVESGQISNDKDLKTISNLLYTFMMGLRVVGKTRPKKKESLATVEVILSLLD